MNPVMNLGSEGIEHQLAKLDELQQVERQKLDKKSKSIERTFGMARDAIVSRKADRPKAQR